MSDPCRELAAWNFRIIDHPARDRPHHQDVRGLAKTISRPPTTTCQIHRPLQEPCAASRRRRLASDRALKQARGFAESRPPWTVRRHPRGRPLPFCADEPPARRASLASLTGWSSPTTVVRWAERQRMPDLPAMAVPNWYPTRAGATQRTSTGSVDRAVFADGRKRRSRAHRSIGRTLLDGSAPDAVSHRLPAPVLRSTTTRCRPLAPPVLLVGLLHGEEGQISHDPTGRASAPSGWVHPFTAKRARLLVSFARRRPSLQVLDEHGGPSSSRPTDPRAVVCRATAQARRSSPSPARC